MPGYRIRLVDDNGADVPPGEVGDLLVSGGSIFAGYWRRQEVTRRVLQGEWYHTGDKYRRDVDGYYWYMGRADDLLRVSGHWVSPTEVEAALVSHRAVLEAAVLGKEDDGGLIKPKAFVVLRDGFQAAEELAEELKTHVKSTSAPYQYPRWIEFRDSLPKTATGKNPAVPTAIARTDHRARRPASLLACPRISVAHEAQVPARGTSSAGHPGERHWAPGITWKWPRQRSRAIDVTSRASWPHSAARSAA